MVIVLGGHGKSTTKTASDNTGFPKIAADITALADRIGIIAYTAIFPKIVVTVWTEGIVPKTPITVVISPGIRSRGVAAHIDPVPAAPLIGRTVTGGQGGSDQDQFDMFGLFHYLTVMNIW